MTSSPAAPTLSDHVGIRIREGRRRNGWTVQQLADRCSELGAPTVTAAVVTNIELGRRGEDGRRRREVTVEELLLFAQALSIAPVHLLVPVAETESWLVTGGLSISSCAARAWVRGNTPITGVDRRIFFSEVPEAELRG